MGENTSSGYDAAATTRQEDDLDRWRFAAEIVDVVVTTPQEWSARIGIFGKWGEGKSTVLRFVEQMLRERKSIVFWFNPWAIQSWNDLWEDFGNRLSSALSDAGIPVDSTWLKLTKNSTKWLEHKSVKQIVKVGAAVAGHEKAADAAYTAFGLVRQWLKYDGPQIRAIQRKAKGKRLVVLIDDLDRCTPELLPKLLLSLRELLDLPGFTFLLAFDNEIVSDSLTETNPAWPDGSDFLEKILDFRFHLPPVSEKQNKRLVLRALAKYCPFVPEKSVGPIEDLLPTNPRKLKTLIRSLAALKPQIARHGPGEFIWTDMWLAQMLRHESYPFFEQLLTGDKLDKEVGTLYRLLKGGSRNKIDGIDQEKDQVIGKLIEESGVKNPRTIGRILRRVDAARSRATPMFRYACEMAIRPHAVTWKEFEALVSRWSRDQTLSLLANWINQHASERHVSVEDIETEFFEAIVNRRHSYLVSAAESASVDEQKSNADQALLLLRIAEQYLVGLEKLGASEFKRLYGQASYWIGFRRNPSDKALRDHEEILLLKLLGWASPALSTELFESIYPENGFLGHDESRAPRAALRDKCLEIVFARAAHEAIDFFRREGAINSLNEGGR
ncbi:MAG: P-loop NTPase fold protein, partial [Candidatus Acidiferrum sp.]